MNILVLSTEEYLTLRLLKCLTAIGADVTILNAGEGSALRASRHCRCYSSFDRAELSDPNGALLARIEQICRKQVIDVILPSGMASGFFLASIQNRLSVPTLPLPTLDMLQLLDNKWLFSRLLEEHHLPFPVSRLLEQVEDGDTLDLKFPVIVKPLNLDASRGVTRCNTRQEVAAHLQSAGATLPLLAQEFIPGADVGLGLLASGGNVLASTIQRQTPDGSGVEFIDHPEILEIGRRIMAICNYDGIAHFDLRIDSRDGSVKILECNPRFWASLPFCMLAGVNFADLGVRLTRNQRVPETICRPVRIVFPTKVLFAAFRGRTGRRSLGRESQQALRFTLSDPVPNIVLGAQKVRRKLDRLLLRFFPKTSREAYK